VAIAVDSGGLSVLGAAPDSVTISGTLAAVNIALAKGITIVGVAVPGLLSVTVATAGLDVACAVIPVAINAPLDVEDARNALLAGFTSIPVANPGYMLAFGDQAFIIARYTGATAYTDGPLIAAASWGAGRVVAVPILHTFDTYSFGATASTFYSNIVSWLARSSSKSVKIVVLPGANAPFFATAGFTNVVTADVTSPAGLASALAGASVLWAAWMGTNVPSGSIAAIRSFVAGAGGGVAIAEYGIGYTWWWNMALPSVPGNVLLREAGICFLGGNRWDGPTIDATNRPPAGEAKPGVTRALVLLRNTTGTTAFTSAQRAEAAALVTGMRAVLPPLFPPLAIFNGGCGSAGTYAAVDTVHGTLKCARCTPGCATCVGLGLALAPSAAQCSACNETAGLLHASNGSLCVSVCSAGELRQLGVVAKPGVGAAVPAVCVAVCGSGTWVGPGMGTCRACSTCNGSSFQSSACVATADSVCTACSAACAGCSGPTPLECTSCSQAAPLLVLGACVSACPSWMVLDAAGDACGACGSPCGVCDGTGAAVCSSTSSFVQLSVTISGSFDFVSEATAAALRAAAAALLSVDASSVHIVSMTTVAPVLRARQLFADTSRLLIVFTVEITNAAASTADALAAATSTITAAAWLAQLHAAGMTSVTSATPGARPAAVVQRPTPSVATTASTGVIGGTAVAAVLIVAAAVAALVLRQRRARRRINGTVAAATVKVDSAPVDEFGAANPIGSRRVAAS
jgi:hypothetical protein